MSALRLHLCASSAALLFAAVSACGAEPGPEGERPPAAVVAESVDLVAAPASSEASVEPIAEAAPSEPPPATAPVAAPAAEEEHARRAPPRGGIEAAVDELFVDYTGEGTPGAALMVIDRGARVLVKGYGYARLQGAVPVASNTNFRLASVTKQFTATAVLMLVDRGALKLDDSIRSHLPELPAFADAIQVRHVLQHTSGLRGYGPLVTEVFPEQISDRRVYELLSETEDTYFEPGTKYRYSNAGYALLAVLVEELSGQSFAEFLRVNIFDPVGMHASLAYERGVSTIAHRARGYVVTETGVTPSDQNVYSALLGDGGVYSSLDDMFAWDQALRAHELISPELERQALTPGLKYYGFGQRIDVYKGHRRVHHGGSTCGFRTFYQRFPDEQLSVVVLTNRAKPQVVSLAEAVTDLYLPDRSPPAEEAPVEPPAQPADP